MADMWRSALAGYEIGSDAAGKVMAGFARREAGRAGIALSEAGDYAEKNGAVPVQAIPVEGEQPAAPAAAPTAPTAEAPAKPAAKPTAMPESTTPNIQTAEGQRVASAMKEAKATDLAKLESGAAAAEIAVKSEQYPASDKEVVAYRVDPVATTRWDTAMEKLRKAAMKQADPMKFLQDGEAQMRKLQQEGFLRNANAAADLMASGQHEQAALALTRAYSYVPDGRAMALQVVKGADGKPRGITGYVYKEGGETFAPVATPWIEDPKQIIDLAVQMKDPTAFTQMVEQRRRTDVDILNADYEAKVNELNLALKKQEVSRDNKKWVSDFTRAVTTDWAKMDLESRKFAVEVLSSVSAGLSGGKDGKYNAGDLGMKLEEMQANRTTSETVADELVASQAGRWSSPGIQAAYEAGRDSIATLVETSVLDSRRTGDSSKIVSPQNAAKHIDKAIQFSMLEDGKGGFRPSIEIVADTDDETGALVGYTLVTNAGEVPIRASAIPLLKGLIQARLDDPNDPLNQKSPAAVAAMRKWLAREYPNPSGLAGNGAGVGVGMSAKDKARITGLADGFQLPPKPKAPELPELEGTAPKTDVAKLLSHDAKRRLGGGIPTP